MDFSALHFGSNVFKPNTFNPNDRTTSDKSESTFNITSKTNIKYITINKSKTMTAPIIKPLKKRLNITPTKINTSSSKKSTSSSNTSTPSSNKLIMIKKNTSTLSSNTSTPKIKNAFDFITMHQKKINNNKKKKSNTKTSITKPRKPSKSKIIQSLFLDLSWKQQKMLVNHIDDGDFDTMAGSLGFTSEQNETLQLYLKSYLNDINTLGETQHEFDISIVFQKKPANWLPSAIIENWKSGSSTYKLICKRFWLIMILKHTDIIINKEAYQNIARTIVAVKTVLLNIKKKLCETKIKLRNQITISINETIQRIMKSDNQSRELNRLCDNIIKIKKELIKFTHTLKQNENTIWNLLEHDLKITKNKEQLTIKTATGQIKLKAPKLFELLLNIIKEVSTFRNDLYAKYTKITQIEVADSTLTIRSNKIQEARKKDLVRKKASETNQSKQNIQIKEYDYTQKSGGRVNSNKMKIDEEKEPSVILNNEANSTAINESDDELIILPNPPPSQIVSSLQRSTMDIDIRNMQLQQQQRQEMGFYSQNPQYRVQNVNVGDIYAQIEKLLQNLLTRQQRKIIFLRPIIPKNDKEDVIDKVNQFMTLLHKFLLYTFNGDLLCHSIAVICVLSIDRNNREKLMRNYVNENGYILLKILHIVSSLLMFGVINQLKEYPINGLSTRTIFKLFLKSLTIICKKYNLCAFRGIKSDISLWEPLLLKLGSFNVRKKIFEICCECGRDKQYSTNEGITVNVYNCPGSSNVLHSVEYCAQDECDVGCGRKICKLTVLNVAPQQLNVYFDQLIATNFDYKNLLETKVITEDGYIHLYELQMMIILNQQHYFCTSINRNKMCTEWETLCGKIRALQRISEIKTSEISMLVYRKITDDLSPLHLGMLFTGFARETSDKYVTMYLCQMMAKFYANKQPIKANENDIYSVMFSKNKDKYKKEQCLKKIRKEMEGK